MMRRRLQEWCNYPCRGSFFFFFIFICASEKMQKEAGRGGRGCFTVVFSKQCSRWWCWLSNGGLAAFPTRACPAFLEALKDTKLKQTKTRTKQQCSWTGSDSGGKRKQSQATASSWVMWWRVAKLWVEMLTCSTAASLHNLVRWGCLKDAWRQWKSACLTGRSVLFWRKGNKNKESIQIKLNSSQCNSRGTPGQSFRIKFGPNTDGNDTTHPNIHTEALHGSRTE